MDKKQKRYYVIFLMLQLFLPLCTGLGYLLDRTFVLAVPWLELLLLSAATVFLTQKLCQGDSSRWLIVLLPFSILNGFVLLLQGWLGGVSALACLICGWLILEHSPKGSLKGVCYFLCFLLTLFFVLVIPLWGFAQTMGVSKTVRKEVSPDKRYTAIVRNNDEGALGGDTVVEIRDNRRSIHILLGQFVDSTELWRGGWGEYEGMTLCWKDEKTLEINGISYTVSGENAVLIADISHTLGAGIVNGQVLEHRDDHGGFHGDGSTFVKIQGSCAVPDSEFWHTLPATENIQKAICLSGTPVIPEVENGYWFFYDRHSQSIDRSSDASLHQRSSWNFTLAVYDPDAGMLYYYEFDT